jgi:hypothetical protein
MMRSFGRALPCAPQADRPTSVPSIRKASAERSPNLRFRFESPLPATPLQSSDGPSLAGGTTDRRIGILRRMLTTRRTSLVLLLSLLAVVAGCDKSELTSPTGGSPAPEDLIRESWDACYLDGSRIGYVHTAYYRDTVAGAPGVRIVVNGKLALVRFGKRVEQESSETTWRTDEGAVSRFDIVAGLGESRQATTGAVTGDKATLQLTIGGKPATQTIDWPAGTRSSTGVEDELRASPPKAGEARRFPMFLPMFNSVVDVDLKHVGIESVELDGSRRDLARIDVRATPRGQAAQHLDSTYWIDEQGETLKLAIPALKMTAVRTTAERARALNTQPLPDFAAASFVRPDRPLADAHRMQFARYRATLAEGAAAEAFPAATYQAVQPAADGSAEITVVALRPDVPSPAGAKQVPPGEADRQANPFIESDDPELARAAAANGGADPDPWTTSLRLESFVKAYLEDVNFSQLFATAGEAYRSRKGRAGLRLPHVDRSLHRRSLDAARRHARPGRHLGRVSQSERYELQRRRSADDAAAGNQALG